MSPFGVAGTESMHTSRRRLDTILPTNVVETKAAKEQPAPASTHRQTTHNQETRTVKTNPRSQEAGSNLNNPSRTFLQISMKTAPENQNSRAQAAHTSEQVATMYPVTARPLHYTKRLLERQLDHQTAAGRRESRRHPHIYIMKIRCITAIIFKIFRVDFSLVEAGPASPFSKPSGGENETAKGSTTLSTRFPAVGIQGHAVNLRLLCVSVNPLFFFITLRNVLKRIMSEVLS